MLALKFFNVLGVERSFTFNLNSQNINNSTSLNEGKHLLNSARLSQFHSKRFYDTISLFPHSFSFDWEDISNSQNHVWPHLKTCRGATRCISTLCVCLEMWSSTSFVFDVLLEYIDKKTQFVSFVFFTFSSHFWQWELAWTKRVFPTDELRDDQTATSVRLSTSFW